MKMNSWILIRIVLTGFYTCLPILLQTFIFLLSFIDLVLIRYLSIFISLFLRNFSQRWFWVPIAKCLFIMISMIDRLTDLPIISCM